MDSSTLHELKDLTQRTALLLQRDAAYLREYWNQDVPSFFSNSDRKGSVSVTSSCFCIFYLLTGQGPLKRFLTLAQQASAEEFSFSVARSLCGVKWKSEDLKPNNIYTAPIVVTALCELGNAFPKSVGPLLAEASNATKIQTAYVSIANHVIAKGAAAFTNYPPSAYLTYWSFRALASVKRSQQIHDVDDRKLTKALRAAASWAERETFRQLSLFASNDIAGFDATQLGFAVAIYAESYPYLIEPPNRSVVERAVDTLFAAQLSDGLWPKAHPIFHYRTRGNVYPFSFELVDVVLAAKSIDYTIYSRHLPKLRQLVQWAKLNQIETANGKGWRSNNLLVHGGPEAWSTAAVFLSLRRIERLAEVQINDILLNEFSATRISARDMSRFDQRSFYDADVPGARPESLKKLILGNLVEPHLSPTRDQDRKYSAVLFGPPGTAKTSIAKAVAYALGWSFVYLQTSDFAGEGVAHVTGRAREVFGKLLLLTEVVILFDEVEEFVRDRDDERSSAESRMITTAMLSLIQELRQSRRVIFIVATNFLKKFDAAITRAGGRFDLLILVAPPSKSEKLRLFNDVLRGTGIQEPFCGRLQEIVQELLEKHFDGMLEYFAFSEWQTFCRKLCGRGGTSELSVVDAEGEMRQMADGIALKGDFRKDYIASRQWVRVF